MPQDTNPQANTPSLRQILETGIRAISRDDDPNVLPTIDAIEQAIIDLLASTKPEKREKQDWSKWDKAGERINPDVARLWRVTNRVDAAFNAGIDLYDAAIRAALERGRDDE